MSEKISQLVDSELDHTRREQVFDQLVYDKSAARCWQRYHLIGSVIRNEVTYSGADLSERISKQLDNEPTVLSPNTLAKPSTNSQTDNSQTDIWKPISIFAMAASLALVAVVTFNPLDNNTQSDVVAATSNTGDIDQVERFAQEFDEMLAEHGEFTASSGLNGLLTYAKLVSNEQLRQK